MNAKMWNAFTHAAFTHGGHSDVLLWGCQESERQCEEVRQEEQAQAQEIMRRGLKSFALKACPCGCGLQGDICQAHASKLVADDEEIPF